MFFNAHLLSCVCEFSRLRITEVAAIAGDVKSIKLLTTITKKTDISCFAITVIPFMIFTALICHKQINTYEKETQGQIRHLSRNIFLEGQLRHLSR
jgi:hypothetical protein